MLGNDEVHIWLLDVDSVDVADVLSSEERERAAQLVFVGDRRRFVARRSLLRHVLGHYLDAPPHAVELDVRPHGKPVLAGLYVRSGVSFNQSASDRFTLIAVAAGRELGVDIERIDPRDLDEAVIRRFFSPWEVARLTAAPESQRPELFFSCWTMKEAVMKLSGLGAALPPDQFDVDPLARGPSRLRAIRCPVAGAAAWSVRPLSVGPDFCAALAVDGPVARVIRRHELG